jgi:MerR family mercuric resistance operon transcriptional regulator
MKNQNSMTIGGLAKAADVGVETIRFYERKSLIEQPPKINGFRQYSGEDVRLIKLIKRLQNVGFTLDEIKDFLLFNSCCSESTKVVREKSLIKIKEINEKIAELKNAVRALETFANTCGSKTDKSSSCELLDCFENDWACCDNSAD